MIGSVSDQTALIETLEYGRAFRQADQPVVQGNQAL
ncbi:conserved hypothetical protein [Planktothrix sp. PCC 11201]|nr:conserved hypothetical protein [Planktothrix sp. PCC 11201]